MNATMPETKPEMFARIARDARETYIDHLTDVAWLALQDAGLRMEHGGREYEALRDAVRGAV